MQPIPFGPDHTLCWKCLNPKKNGTLKNCICPECMEVHKVQGRKALAESDKRLVGKAATEFLANIQKIKDGASVSPVVFEKLLEKLGGPEGMVDKLIEDFNAVRGPDGVASANVKYWTLFKDLMTNYDENVSVDVSNLSDDDLVAVITPVAEKLIKKDRELRQKLIKQMIDDDPEFKKEVMEIGGAVVFDVNNKPKETPLLMDYEEAGDSDDQ